MNQFQTIQTQTKCPKCSESNFWETSDSRLKCKNCRRLFKPKPNPLNLSNQILSEVITEFLLGHSTNIILERVNISKYKLLKALTILRILMTKDLPEVFRKIVKLDDTYLAKTINKKDLESLKVEKTKFEFKPLKQPIIGILYLEGEIFAKILSNIEARDLKFLLKKRDKKKEAIFPDNWGSHFGLIFKGRVYRLTSPEDKKESRINVLEGFWGYLKRKLAAKGGVRKEKLPLYLGEYVWRHNHRKLTLKEQEKLLLNLVFQYFNFEN